MSELPIVELESVFGEEFCFRLKPSTIWFKEGADHMADAEYASEAAAPV